MTKRTDKISKSAADKAGGEGDTEKSKKTASIDHILTQIKNSGENSVVEEKDPANEVPKQKLSSKEKKKLKALKHAAKEMEAKSTTRGLPKSGRIWKTPKEK